MNGYVRYTVLIKQGRAPKNKGEIEMKKTLSHEQYDALSESVREAIDEMFQFTPLREGRLPCHIFTPHVTSFNSRPCVRGDPCYVDFTRRCAFQFTPLREGRLQG